MMANGTSGGEANGNVNGDGCNKGVVVNFLSQLIFIFPSFLAMVMYDNEFKTKEK